VIDRRPSGKAVLDGVETFPASLSLSWIDPLAQWGLGVFETLAIRDGEPRFVDEHRERWEIAAAHLAIPLPSIIDMTAATQLVASSIEGGHGWLKLIASRSGHWAAFGGVSDPADEWKPVNAVILPWRRHRLEPTAGLKTNAYAASMLGLEEAHRLGADEGIWLNDRGHVVEACTANIFIVSGRALTTPALSDGARDGVTRARTLEALRGQGLAIHQSKIRVLNLRHADEVFLTSSLCGVRAVLRIDGRDIRGGRPGDVTKRLEDTLHRTTSRTEVSGG
jgi:branched-subunit amino acid aminotransferase/4-amino-4-deoxychorismate lyase